jgi:CRISPR-associated endonuclease/helicase Cas3
VLVVPANYGGCDEWGWNPDSRLPVRDIGNEVALDSTGRRILRLLPELLEVTPKNLEGAEEDASPRELLENFRRSIDAEREVDRDSREEAELALRKGIAQQYGPDRGFESPSWRFSIEANLGTVLLTNAETRKGQRTPPSTEVQSKEDQSNEDDGASLGQRLVSLKDHVDGVVEQTKELADGCGLPGDIRSDLVLAAKLHDLGKADERFQALLRLASESALAEEAFASGDPSDKPELLLAKSGGPPISGRRFKRIQRLSGYPSRCRHEFLSLALADECPLLAGAHDANLVRHLIGTHHGFGRALAPWWLEDEPIPVSVEVEEAGKVSIDSSAARRFALLDSEWPDQYWRLVERYGAWGLAYLESILRRADCLRSAWESEHGANAARG